MMLTDTEIRLQNPWWAHPEAIGEDPHLKAFHQSLVQWTPPVLEEIPLRFGDTATLRGPRQVGKTTTLKRLAERLIRRGESRVLYYAFDLATDPSDIPAMIRRAKALHPNPDGPWYILLDEVTWVRNWARGVKYAWDHGTTREDFVLCTGSSARRMGAEQLVGRRGRGHDYLQLTMSFRDYCTTVRRLELPPAIGVTDLLTEAGHRTLKVLNLQREALDDALAEYGRVGGFPRAIADRLATGRVMPETIQMLWGMIAHDIQEAQRDRTAALKLLERIGKSLGSALAWTSATQDMGVASHATVKEYAQVLAEAFTVLTIFHWDLSGGGLETAPFRKLYFIDPLIGEIAPLLLRHDRRIPEDGVFENLVATALYRCATDSLVQAEPLPSAIGYWKSAAGTEIDFVVDARVPGLKARRLPIEVKGDGARGISGARRSIRFTYGRGVVVSRTVFDLDPDIPVIPGSVLLAALGERTQRQWAEL